MHVDMLVACSRDNVRLLQCVVLCVYTLWYIHETEGLSLVLDGSFVCSESNIMACG